MWNDLKIVWPPAISVTVVYFFLANATPDMPISTASVISWGVGFVVTILWAWGAGGQSGSSKPVFSLGDIFSALAVSFFTLWIPIILEFVWALI
jgi:multidrug transporter EmrE-like cation transporter